MQIRLKLAVAFLIAIGATQARAQGIPVIDAANLVQTVQQVINDITAINNQVQQISQLQGQLDSINGIRNLGNVFNNPSLKNYVPAESYTLLNAVSSSGYAGLNATAKALRDTGMVYNCLELSGTEPKRLPSGLIDNAYAGWDGRAEIRWPRRGLALEMRANTSSTHLSVYSPPQQAAKDFVCLEPVTHRNGAHLAVDPLAQGLVELRLGQHLKLEVSLAVTYDPH